MLNVWINYPKGEYEDCLVGSPDAAFENYMDLSLVLTDLGRDIVKNVSKIAEIHNIHSYTTEWGYDISPADLSGGSKVLLLMMCKNVRDLNLIFNYTYCGDNCNVYLEKLAGMYDINIYLGRSYVPSREFLEKYGAKFMETGVVVHKVMDFWDQVCEVREASKV